MDHRLVLGIEKALGWGSAVGLGQAFAYGTLPDVSLCSRLLTPTKLLDLVMRRSLAAHRLRCLVNGSDLHPQHYLTTSTTRRGQGVPMADMRRLGRLLADGCTLIVDEANAYDPTLEVACRALQWWAHELVQVNTYLTTSDAAGFQLHWDDHDVLIVQLAGEKRWEVRGQSRVAPMYRDAAPNPEVPQEVVWSGILEAGDVLHIPRGYWHRATREDQGDGYSLHMTFGFPKRTGVDYLAWIADQSRREVLFRHDLKRWGRVDDLAQQHDALMDGAMRLIASTPPEEFLGLREQQRPAGRHVSTHNLFGPIDAVVCVAEFEPSIHRNEQQLVVRAAGKEISFMPEAEDALRHLLSGRPAHLEAVSDATGIDVNPLADVLVAEGICAEATPELLSGYAGVLTPSAPSATSLPTR